MAIRMSVARCCCTPICPDRIRDTTFSDDFNRALLRTIDGYLELPVVPNSARIVSSTLLEVANSDDAATLPDNVCARYLNLSLVNLSTYSFELDVTRTGIGGVFMLGMRAYRSGANFVFETGSTASYLALPGTNTVKLEFVVSSISLSSGVYTLTGDGKFYLDGALKETRSHSITAAYAPTSADFDICFVKYGAYFAWAGVGDPSFPRFDNWDFSIT